MRSFQSSRVNSVNGARRWMPALLTRMSGRSPVLLDLADTAVDGGLIGDVERADPRLAAGLLRQVAGRGLDLVEVATVDGDPAAGLEQPLGEGQPDAAAGPADQCGGAG